MPRGLNTDFINEKNKAQNRPIFLYSIYDYDGIGSILNLASYDTDVVFDGVTYTKFPMRHDRIGENTNGAIDNVKVKISNVSRSIQYYLELYDWRNKKVRITTVFADYLTDPDIKREDVFYISSYSANESVAEFTLTSKFNVLGVMIPKRIYSRNYCGLRFKSTECGYAGAGTECNKTKARCKELLNYERFGGFPSIPAKQFYA